MQTNGTYIEQFLDINKVVYKGIDECDSKNVNLAVASVTEWYIDDKVDGLKHTTTKIRFDIDDDLFFLSDAKALLLATSIIKNVAKNTDEDVKGVIRKLASDLEVEA